ncbi:gliding motility-associated ABC transporter ATP-binding subunit GldA [Galbibacter mesophilus]|uniref:gliding motility-associated ABC transporter ATP-binding subunit GldA n=1 Tax=Galbibacter mesophilus TaxID=379069 RepID=UPI00191F73A6|nr:gliding motility-associated ABC transporter ATP-binding subunit GldA [Galbibacter mesophilus]MCM5661398.1 gliding motility-associated ABC transporter ATP-binding subunit GldA [Galbibacter mesophilus]
MSITVSNIKKIYGSQEALKGVSFSINKGEIVGFLGPNGAGKSTMMKILTTYLPPSEGKAMVNSFDTETQKMDVKKSVGYLPEHNPLHLDMYVREYLNYTASLYKVSTKNTEEVISQCGLLPEANKKIGALSKGYRQRVGLAAALIGNPEVLILDEPTTGLDPNQLLEIRKLIKSIGKEKTVLLSTHIMQEVEAICDRVIIINKGEIVADKKLSDLRNSEEQIVQVEFDYRVEDVLLKQLPLVKDVKNTIGFVYEITFKTDKDMRATVFDFAHDNGLKTLQLNQKNKNLESLFIELTNK